MNQVMEVKLSIIKIGDRARKDLGDLDARLLLEGDELLDAINSHEWTTDGLKISETARIGRKAEAALRAKAQQKSIEKSEWITAARISFQPGDRQSCHVCGQFKGVSQAHHVAPLGIQHNMGVKHAIQDFVWLCPTHHAIAHTVISEHAKGEHTPCIDGVPPEDLDKIEKISKRGFDLILSALSFERGAK
jgi:hypothetical protein